MSAPLTALDLFAGTGWGIACKRLGIREMGVEIMPEAIATRDANGMATIYRDVWDGLEGKFHVPNYQVLIASPPCQTFSLAGSGSGRAALNEVLEAIELHAYKDPTQLREFGERHDPRTALVLAPLAHVWRDRPEYVAFEQVPTVLPVWEACAKVMQEWGYSTDVAIRPMDAPAPTITAGHSTADRGFIPGPVGDARTADGRILTIDEAAALQTYPAMLRSNYGTGGDSSLRGERTINQPAPTLTSKADRNKWDGNTALSQDEAATLQTYERPFEWVGPKTKTFLQIGNAVPPLLAQVVLEALTAGRAA